MDRRISEIASPQVPMTITLRRLTTANIEAVHTLLSDWNVVRYMLLPHCTTNAETRKCLNELLVETPRWGLDLRHPGD